MRERGIIWTGTGRGGGPTGHWSRMELDATFRPHDQVSLVRLFFRCFYHKCQIKYDADNNMVFYFYC